MIRLIAQLQYQHDCTCSTEILVFRLMSEPCVEIDCVVSQMLKQIFLEIRVAYVEDLAVFLSERLHFSFYLINMQQVWLIVKIQYLRRAKILQIQYKLTLMARIQVNIRFFYQGVLYADTRGFIPRHEAIKIPQLRVEQNEIRAALTKKVEPPAKETKRGGKSKYEQEMEQENVDQNEEMEMEMEAEDVENQIQQQIDDIDDEEQQEIEDNQIQENQFDNQNEECQEEDDEIDESNEDNDLSELSRSISPNVNYGKYKTKRQKGQLDNFLELPLKKPRKDAKKFDQATQLIRKQEKERKRRQYIKKLNEAQEKATFDKILNETGRKFRQRQEKQMKEVKQKDGKSYRTLGDVPKTITKQNSRGTYIYLNRTQLFEPSALHQPDVKMHQPCSICHQSIGKYKTKLGQRFCSVECFKRIHHQSNSNKMCA